MTDFKDKKIKSLEKQKSFAFAKFYNECKRKHTEYIELYHKHKKMSEDLEVMCENLQELSQDLEQAGQLPLHVISELKEMYVKEKKIIECPICYDIIEVDNLVFSSCLHKYCKGCYDRLLEQEEKKCAVCRKKLFIKK